MELSPKVTGNLEKYLKEELGKDIFSSMHRRDILQNRDSLQNVNTLW